MNAPDQPVIRVAALYARVSTDQQAMRKDGSLDTQEDLLRKLIEQKRALGEQWEFKLYREEGVSGKTLDRPRFQEMVADIKAGRVQALAVVALDRVARNVRAFLGFLDFLIEHKVDFISLREQVDTGTPVGRLILTFLSALAEFDAKSSALAQRKSPTGAQARDFGTAARNHWATTRETAPSLPTKKSATLWRPSTGHTWKQTACA